MNFCHYSACLDREYMGYILLIYENNEELR